MTMSRPSLAVAAAVALALIAVYAMRENGWPRAGNVLGNFDYYALVLGWAPTYCAERRESAQGCRMRRRMPRAFVLHGLWPQYEKGWPENCRTGDAARGCPAR